MLWSCALGAALALHAAAGAVIPAAPAAGNPFSLTMQADASFALSLSAWPAFQLASAPPQLMVGGVMADLVALAPPDAFTGADALGTFRGLATTFALPGGDPVLAASVWAYDALPAVAFDAYILTDVDSNGTYAQRDGVSSSFPSFAFPSTPTEIAVMRWFGPFLDNGVLGPSFRLWGDATAPLMTDGTGGGPLVFYDAAANHSVVLSPYSAFMTSSIVQEEGGPHRGALRCGLLGSLTSLPAGTSTSYLLWYGPGVNAAATGWGAALLQRHGKAGAPAAGGDFTANTLTYNTDHGSSLWYNTDGYASEDAALWAVYNESVAKAIPYRTLLLDSWWYPKDPATGGVLSWTALPDPAIFPNGTASVAALLRATAWRAVAHNRYWSAKTPYAAANGGGYDFYIDAGGSPAGGGMGVPREARFWVDLFRNATRDMFVSGNFVYIQDWLYNEFLGVDLLTADANAAREWMLQMEAGAAATGTLIQLCMPFPRHALQSVEMPSVTQVRTSDDHVVGTGDGAGVGGGARGLQAFPPIPVHLQWRIGFSNIFAAALGLRPSKDNFYSSSVVEPHGSVGNASEASPSLQNAVSVLSAGPVSAGDVPGYAVAAELLRACTTGGRLLQPSHPAVAIDAELVARVWGPSSGGPIGEVYATYTTVGTGSPWVWAHVLAAALNGSVAVTRPQVAAAFGTHLALRRGGYTAAAAAAAGAPAGVAWGTPQDRGTVAYSLNASTLDAATLQVVAFDTQPLHLHRCGEADFALWHTAPVHSNGWALLGELTKYVPVAEARVTSVAVLGADLLVELQGEAGEAVPLTFWDASAGAAVTLPCVLDAAGTARAVMPQRLCA